MTTWVSMVRTGRGADANAIEIAAGNGFPAWLASTAYTPPMPNISTADQWIFSRWIATVAWLNRWPEADSGPLTRYRTTDAPQSAGSVEVFNAATIAVGHWGLETGWGANEWNFNLSGIHCTPEADQCFREAESAGGEEFQSFDTFPQFATAHFEIVSRQYADAWEAMKAGSANALLRLWRADYTCGAKTRSEATDLCTRVRRVIAAHDAVGPQLPTVEQIRATEADVPNRCTPSSRNRGGTGGSGGGQGSSNGRTLLYAAIFGLGLAAMNRRQRG